MPISRESQEVTGIADADVAGAAPTWAEAAPEWRAFLEGATLHGYNAKRFDVPLLRCARARRRPAAAPLADRVAAGLGRRPPLVPRVLLLGSAKQQPTVLPAPAHPSPPGPTPVPNSRARGSTTSRRWACPSWTPAASSSQRSSAPWAPRCATIAARSLSVSVLEGAVMWGLEAWGRWGWVGRGWEGPAHWRAAPRLQLQHQQRHTRAFAPSRPPRRPQRAGGLGGGAGRAAGAGEDARGRRRGGGVHFGRGHGGLRACAAAHARCAEPCCPPLGGALPRPAPHARGPGQLVQRARQRARRGVGRQAQVGGRRDRFRVGAVGCGGCRHRGQAATAPGLACGYKRMPDPARLRGPQANAAPPTAHNSPARFGPLQGTPLAAAAVEERDYLLWLREQDVSDEVGAGAGGAGPRGRGSQCAGACGPVTQQPLPPLPPRRADAGAGGGRPQGRHPHARDGRGAPWLGACARVRRRRRRPVSCARPDCGAAIGL
jgi:hypothetical protein